MVQQARNLFDAATARGRVVKQGDIACIIMDGNGAVIVSMQDFQQAQKWAQSKLPSANLLSDRARFLDQFSVLVSRPGSVQATRGNDRQLARLAKSMSSAGYDLGEWTLPPQLRRVSLVSEPGSPRRRKTDPPGAEPHRADHDSDLPQTPQK